MLILMICDRMVTRSADFVDFALYGSQLLVWILYTGEWMVVCFSYKSLTISDRHKLHKTLNSFECLVDKIYGDYQ